MLGSLLARTQKRLKLTGVLLLINEELVDSLTNLVVGDLDVVLGGAVVKHEGKETVVSDVELQQALVQITGRWC